MRYACCEVCVRGARGMLTNAYECLLLHPTHHVTLPERRTHTHASYARLRMDKPLSLPEPPKTESSRVVIIALLSDRRLTVVLAG
jgi:hypothetical protein